jgi:hypothetical protein
MESGRCMKTRIVSSSSSRKCLPMDQRQVVPPRESHAYRVRQGLPSLTGAAGEAPLTDGAVAQEEGGANPIDYGMSSGVWRHASSSLISSHSSHRRQEVRVSSIRVLD